MTPRSNIHTHTTYADGRDMPEDMLQAALWLGFHTLGFSEHGHADYDDCSMPAEVEPVYRAEILRLRDRYAGQIDVLLGYEHDWLTPYPADRYDFVIESVHYVRAGDALVCVDESRPILENAAITFSSVTWPVLHFAPPLLRSMPGRYLSLHRQMTVL